MKTHQILYCARCMDFLKWILITLTSILALNLQFFQSITNVDLIPLFIILYCAVYFLYLSKKRIYMASLPMIVGIVFAFINPTVSFYVIGIGLLLMEIFFLTYFITPRKILLFRRFHKKKKPRSHYHQISNLILHLKLLLLLQL